MKLTIQKDKKKPAGGRANRSFLKSERNVPVAEARRGEEKFICAALP
ncbi:hypothetical protein [Pseudomonas fluorescens]|nr:hypothetical protein [Pseudomonas fluorescens]